VRGDLRAPTFSDLDDDAHDAEEEKPDDGDNAAPDNDADNDLAEETEDADNNPAEETEDAEETAGTENANDIAGTDDVADICRADTNAANANASPGGKRSLVAHARPALGAGSAGERGGASNWLRPLRSRPRWRAWTARAWPSMVSR
jgi:hypothetical protein